MLEKDKLKFVFEAYMLAFYQKHKRFTIEDFGTFATTLLNYQVNTQIIVPADKQEAALYLTQLFNKGIGNRITEEDLLYIAKTISQDYSLDLALLEEILHIT